MQRTTVDEFRRMAGIVPELKKQPVKAKSLGVVGEQRVVVTLTIPGTPIGKPRMTRSDKWKKRPCVMRYREWADAARAAVGSSVPHPSCIERLDWTAYFEPPASWSAKKRAAAIGKLHRSKPDRDNIDKAILDALFKEDSGIACGTIEKRWGHTSRVEISITIAK